MEGIEYWQKRLRYYQQKYGKNSIEAKAAEKNLKKSFIEREQEEAMEGIRAWGIAAGRRSTKNAAAGAFTWREYEEDNFPKDDWITILLVEKIK